MVALKITEIKDFMGKLLKGTTFDSFWLVEAVITTYNTFSIDGSLHKNFFEPAIADALTQSQRTNSTWAELKAYCFSIIKGKRTPLHFKIVFQLSRKNTEAILLESQAALRPQDVHGLYLNFQYNGEELLCTTGTSYGIFTMDKSLDHTWDQKIMNFFRQQNIAFVQL